MIERAALADVRRSLTEQAAVVLVGPRQVGKTTLALDLCDADEQGAVYLDLESAADRDRLSDPRLFLEPLEDRLVVLDEIHRLPGLFTELRGLIDHGRRRGHRCGRFLLLGSASLDLLRQSGESLAGRVAQVDLGPLTVTELPSDLSVDSLWLRGGFPDSLLASSDAASARWRADFIRTYLERDVPQFGPRIPSETLRRLWTMLAHSQGQLLNVSRLARGLSLSSPTVASYIDLLCDLLLVRRLPPFLSNAGKRLVKSPKTYVRDSGLVHALLGLGDGVALAGHPVVGSSWEGFVIENLIAAAPTGAQASFFRTAAGAECDLVLDLSRERAPWVVEIKRSLSVSLTKSFHRARADVAPSRTLVVHAGDEDYPLGDGMEARSLASTMRELEAIASAR